MKIKTRINFDSCGGSISGIAENWSKKNFCSITTQTPITISTLLVLLEAFHTKPLSENENNFPENCFL